MTKPGNLPANWVTGNTFTAAAEDNVETAVNWLLGGYTSGGALSDPTISGYTETVTALGTVTTSATLSISSGTVLTATLTASTACTFTMPAVGAGKSFTLLLNQAAGGSGSATFTGVKWDSSGAPTVTTTGHALDIFSFVSDGTYWYGVYNQGFSTLSPASFDNTGISAYQNVASSGSPFTWTQPATAGAYAVVCLFNAAGTMTPSGATPSITFGGTAMTSLGSVLSGGASGNGWIWVFGVNNVSGGSSVTVSVTLTQSGDTFQGYGSSYTYTNVASAGSLQTAYGTSGTASVPVSTAAGNIVWGAVMDNAGNALSSFNLTQRQAETGSGGYLELIAGDASGSSVSSVTCTVADDYYWCAAGLNLV